MPLLARRSVEICFEVAEETRERTLRPVFSEAVVNQLNPPKIERLLHTEKMCRPRV